MGKYIVKIDYYSFRVNVYLITNSNSFAIKKAKELVNFVPTSTSISYYPKTPETIIRGYDE